MKIVDSIISLRVLWILITPIETTPAFKLGLIDADGKTVRKAKTAEENAATSPLHRMVWNLKRIIGMVPGGSTRIGSLAAGYLLMREAAENDWNDEQLKSYIIENFESLCEQNQNNEEVESLLDALIKLSEDAPVNATGPAVSTDIPVKKATEKPLIIKRKFKKSLE
jgi:hypothetical protein